MRAALSALFLAAFLSAQKGDHKGEEQPPPPPDLVIPDAPVLSPQQALTSFHIQPGFRIERVASEPLIHDPVLAAFDGHGRLWVVEMRSFMPNVDGTGERVPTSRIVVLEDTDGDGRMDRATPFAEGLVLPRGLFVFEDGALVIEPPNLWFFPDRDRDLRADGKERVAGGFEGGFEQVEHTGNGLVMGLDNSLHLAKHGSCFRRIGNGFVAAPSPYVGQWGLSRSDDGRLFYNYNSTYLFGDLYPARYGERNRHLGRARGINHNLDRDQSTWPRRVTPGINRGYQEHMLREGRLKVFTATCAPEIYRGDLLLDAVGDAFVCEPAGNFVRRSRVVDEGATLTAGNAYDRREFLASTDERFRPVHLTQGPDGALYVVDMYRGILQHWQFVTTFLRRQILERGLDQPIGLGRIYRIVPEERVARPVVLPGTLHGAALVAALDHDNGWTRDMAQRLIVERREPATLAPLRALARNGAVRARARQRALWSLEGTGWLDRADVLAGLGDADPQVQWVALQLAERYLAGGDDPFVLRHARGIAERGPQRLRWQVAHSLGEAVGPDGFWLLVQLALAHLDDPLLQHAVLSGLQGRERRFLEQVLFHPWLREGESSASFLRLLARCIGRERDQKNVHRTLELAALAAPWQQGALLQGLLDALPKGRQVDGHYALPTAPLEWARLAGGERKELAAQLYPALAWGEAVVAEAPLTGAVQVAFRAGAQVYERRCAVCHQRNGEGMRGLAPPLNGSQWVTGSPDRAVRVVLEGLTGKIEVRGESWDLAMEPHGFLSDEEVAAVVTFMRNAWDNRGSAVPVAMVQGMR